jgi:esterase/lipase superfamily enzyme
MGLALAVFSAGCTLDDSGPVRSVFRPRDGRSLYADVVYVTDRAPDAKAPGGFGRIWADAPSCGTAEAVVPPARLAGEPEKWGYVAATRPAACAGAKGPLAGAVALIEKQAAAKGCRSVFLFVHGFHTGFDSAALRAAQVAADARTGCAVAAFGWTSEGNLNRYAVDLERSGYAQPLLAEFLHALADSGLRVTVLGHSMGGRMMLATLAAMGKSRTPPPEGFIDELVLAAADVGAEKGNDDAGHLLRDAAPFAKRITVYASAGDAVLRLAEDAHGGVPRLGENPAHARAYRQAGTHEVDAIDASPVPADAFDHSYYAMSYETIYDLGRTLRGVPVEARMKPSAEAPATLVSGKDGAPELATERRPRLISRILLGLAPLVP